VTPQRKFGNRLSYHRVTKNPQRKNLRQSCRSSWQLNPSRISAPNATGVSRSVIGSSFGRHLQTHPFPKNGRCTCKPSATFPRTQRIPRTLFGQLPRLRRSRASLVPYNFVDCPFPYKPIPKVSKVCSSRFATDPSSPFPSPVPIDAVDCPRWLLDV
jgi:hypothetical protein